MLYNKIFTHKITEDLDDVREYIDTGMYKAAISRINLIKRDILKASDIIENENKIRGKVSVVRKKGNHC